MVTAKKAKSKVTSPPRVASGFGDSDRAGKIYAHERDSEDMRLEGNAETPRVACPPSLHHNFASRRI